MGRARDFPSSASHPCRPFNPGPCILPIALDMPTTCLSLVVVLRFHVNPDIARDGRETSIPPCGGLPAPCRVLWAWFGAALGPNSARNRSFPAGSLKVFRAVLAQPSVLSGLHCRPVNGTHRCRKAVMFHPHCSEIGRGEGRTHLRPTNRARRGPNDPQKTTGNLRIQPRKWPQSMWL